MRHCPIPCGFLLIFASVFSTANAEPTNFARDILPILSNKCFVCHGPDAKDADLVRLDSAEAATKDLGGYRAIDPKAPKNSRLLQRIHSKDEPMPPADAEKQLTDSERQLLTKWINEGGAYSKHWAFIVPKKKKQPKGVAKQQVIDAYIGKQLSQKKIQFAQEAEKSVLARRVSLILTGLPPEPKWLDNYLKDEKPGAYRRFIDRLMKSPRYGEHQARYWLDAVRYGDTHGLHLDNRRGIYPYRDWVVAAMNQNMPLNQFIEWQLAGDLLPSPTLEQLTATGFVRMNPSTAEGGVIPAEFQAKNNFDRTETLGTVLLGMTLTCARCHTHKYDPITQTEYYQLLAFFNSTAESALDGNSYTYGPTARVPKDQATWNLWKRLEKSKGQLLTQIDKTDFSNNLNYAKQVVEFKTNNWKKSDPLALRMKKPMLTKSVDGLPGATKEKLPGKGKAIWVEAELETPVSATIQLSFKGGKGSKAWLDDKPVGLKANDNDFRADLTTNGKARLRIKITSFDKGHLEIRLNNIWQDVVKARKWSDVDEKLRIQLAADSNGPLKSLNKVKQARNVSKLLKQVESQLTTTLVARELPKPRETKLLRRGEYNLPMGDPLTPGTMAIMGSFPKDAPKNRLGLAKWLTSREHPLVARVLVNRIWQRVFGEGLVRSPEDFGAQGQYPTHPELLDWLAVELQDSGWNLKHMLRLMVTSRTFMQDSSRRKGVNDPANLLFARGPSHRLDAEVLRDTALWASQLLDPHMGGEGVKPYQPSGMWLAMAHPASNTKKYVRDKGKLLYRRSLYVYWKRTSPHPIMTLFDAPDRESSCVKRSRTSTSSQSLALLNETQRIEMSRKLAERLIKSGQDDASRIELLFKLLACRNPTEKEKAACTTLLKHMRDRYQGDAESAKKLLAIGDAPRDEKLPPAEIAAWSQLATTVLASDLSILLY